MPDSFQTYRLSPRAKNDLEEIWLFTFKNWSVDQANRYVTDMVSAFELLTTGRIAGRQVDIREGYYKYAIGSHMIYFKITKTTLDIIRILHQRMDVGRHL